MRKSERINEVYFSLGSERYHFQRSAIISVSAESDVQFQFKVVFRDYRKLE